MSNLYSAYIDFMEEIHLKTIPVYEGEPGTEIEFNYNLSEGRDSVYYGFVDSFSKLCGENGWYFGDAVLGWEGWKHWDLWTPEWHYLCKNEDDDHCTGDGLVCFDADMMYWYLDGWYCEFCMEHEYMVDPLRRGRSLAEELKLAKDRGKCYRRLPDPVSFANEWYHMWL